MNRTHDTDERIGDSLGQRKPEALRTGPSIVHYEAGDGFSVRVEVSQSERAGWQVASLTIYGSDASEVALITGGDEPFGVAFSSPEEALRAGQRRGKQEGLRIVR